VSKSDFSRYTSQVAAAIRQTRLAHGDTQEEAAHKAGLSVRAYTRLESGKQNPTLETLYSVAEAFETTPGDILLSANNIHQQK
jgi:transcriptional regulator with XRE-family HTH domain